MNQVVARCLDGRLVKGLVLDFSPRKEVIHVVDPDDSKQMTEIHTSELKALFFVRSFDGDPSHNPSSEFSKENLKGTPGLKLKVTFLDAEVLHGTTNGYSAGRPGFFLIPADEGSNNIRVYVYTAATRSVEAWT
jgi:hypothetical protein